MREIFLAGGCFWGLQKYFDQVVGIITTQVGYANGRTVNPTYEEVCCGDSNFAETVWVRYNENIIDLKGILYLFFRVIDPTVRNRQGNDFGLLRLKQRQIIGFRAMRMYSHVVPP